MYDVLIVGGGPAGMTAAIYARRAGLSVCVLEKLAHGGQMLTTSEIENYPGFPHTDGYTLGIAMQTQAAGLDAVMVSGELTDIVFGDTHTAVTTTKELQARAVILAMGANRRSLDVPGEDRFQGRGISYCATCDGGFFRNKAAAVVGGGDTALEDALYLANLCESVTLIHRREQFRGAKVLEDRVRQHPKIHLKLGYVVEEIYGGAAVEGVRLRQVDYGGAEELTVSGVFAAVGTKPATEILADKLALNAGGFIPAGEDCKTEIPGVFCAGDLRQKPLRQIVTACADGAVAAQAAVEYLQGQG